MKANPREKVKNTKGFNRTRSLATSKEGQLPRKSLPREKRKQWCQKKKKGQKLPLMFREN